MQEKLLELCTAVDAAALLPNQQLLFAALSQSFVCLALQSQSLSEGRTVIDHGQQAEATLHLGFLMLWSQLVAGLQSCREVAFRQYKRYLFPVCNSLWLAASLKAVYLPAHSLQGMSASG